ncbi:MAG: hypothetical protein EBZ69_04760 [Alphaproteobacteria bacterium]|nr:hypothetical protein [Alphaproteobacteria bacterium]NDC56107.1 hypothetical protein [Alphaproteobacteria bacterium]NDG05212.1 hypothetical protein [Alphaproteobacteria bacterium]
MKVFGRTFLAVWLACGVAVAEEWVERDYHHLLGALWQSPQPAAQAALWLNIEKWRDDYAAEEKRRAAQEAALAELYAAPPAGWPVVGNVAQAFGSIDRMGQTLEGVWLNVRPGRVVVAPMAGKVAYVGEIKGYGLALILNLMNGQHLLLAGLGQTDLLVGQSIAQGERLGFVPALDGPNTAKFYVERRQSGKTIPPLPVL